MATEQVAPAVNGNYANQHHRSHDSSGQYLASYSTGEGAGGGNGAVDAFGSQHNSQVTPGSSTSGVDVEPSKDEVGWSFVKQYYRSLHDYPGKLHVSNGLLFLFNSTLRALLIETSCSTTKSPSSYQALKLRKSTSPLVVA
jgi:hypothetical protein